MIGMGIRSNISSTVIIERSVGSLFGGSISCGSRAQQSPCIGTILD